MFNDQINFALWCMVARPVSKTGAVGSKWAGFDSQGGNKEET